MISSTATIREPSGVRRYSWPVVAGIPFAQGVMHKADCLSIWGPDQQPLPVHCSVRTRWPDGSIKWCLADTQVSLEPMAKVELPIKYGHEIEVPDPPTSLSCSESTDTIVVDTGTLQVIVPRRGKAILDSIRWNGGTIVDKGGGCLFTAADGTGIRHESQTDHVEVEENNPLRVVLLIRGRYGEAPVSHFMSWTTRLYFYAGQSFIKLYHTFIQDNPAQSIDLRRLQFKLRPKLGYPVAGALGSRSTHSPHGFQFAKLNKPVTLHQQMVGHHLLDDGDITLYDGNAHGWSSLWGTQAAVTMKLRKPWQNYPKSFSVGPQELTVDLYPEGLEVHAESSHSGVADAGPLRLPQGMAKTHELFLHVGPPPTDVRSIDASMLALEQPLLLNLTPEHYSASGVFGPLPAVLDRYWPLETRLRDLCQTPTRGLGMIDFGDEVNVQLVEGKVQTHTTENLGYDLPSSLLRQYVRTGNQHLFAEAEASVFHLMDVDTVHFDATHPGWIGASRSASTNSLDSPQVSHSWLGGLLDYYFLTGYSRAREVAELCADFCRRSAPYKWKNQLTQEMRQGGLEPDQDWPFNARDVGWPLTAMGTFFSAFPEERFLKAMEVLVDIAEMWQDNDGRWRQAIGSFNRGSDPAATAALIRGLQLYFQATGDQRALEVSLRGISFLVRHGRTIEGHFFCCETPFTDHPHAPAAELLTPLVFAFEATEDQEILQAGYRFFRWLLDSGEAKAFMLKEILAIMPLLQRTGLLESFRRPDIPCTADSLAPQEQQ